MDTDIKYASFIWHYFNTFPPTLYIIIYMEVRRLKVITKHNYEKKGQ